MVMRLVETFVARFRAFTALPGGISGVPYVIDGDTLAIGTIRIRIWGIDAAEMDTRAGQRARLFLIERLKGRTINCIDTGERSYGRIVARCFAEGEDIAWWLVNAGYAIDWPRYSGGYYRSGTSPRLRRFIIAYRRRNRRAQTSPKGRWWPVTMR